MKSTLLQKTLTFFTGLALAMLALTPLAAPAKDSPQNKKLLAALEPFEVLTETALAGDAAKSHAALKTVLDGRADTRALLSGANATHFDELFAQLEAANTKHDNIGESLQAAELYKLMVLALDASTLTVPKEVNLLDYIGFRISALLQARAPDWAAIAATTKEANGYWAAIRDQVGDTKLQGKMDTAQAGLATASEKQDAALMKTNVKKDLDLVDALEGYFSKK